MLKLIHTFDTDWNEKVASLLDVTKFGVEKRPWMKTSGAVLAKEFSELRPSEKYAWVHTLAIGSTEAYGPNRNADGFSEYWLQKKHHTFVKNAHLYRNHNNKDPKKAIGIIKHSAYNPEMRRVELIIGYDKKLASDIVEKLARGEDVAGSMGCRIEFDVCSICEKKSSSPKDYCDHMKKYAGQILEDGRQVFVDNPDPEFFDWSYVDRPADRIAFAFSKVASAKLKKFSADLAYEAGLIYPNFAARSEKFSTLKKLSEIEKQIPVILSSVPSGILDLLSNLDIDDTDTLLRLRSHDPCCVFSALNSRKVLLSPRDFLLLTTTADIPTATEVGQGISSVLPMIFNKLLDDDELQSTLDSSIFDGDCGCNELPSSIFEKLKNYSLEEPVINRRVQIIIVRKKPSLSASDARDGRKGDTTSQNKKVETKKAAEIYTVDKYPEIQSLAKMYAMYKLAAVHNKKNINDPLFLKLIALHNFHHILSS